MVKNRNLLKSKQRGLWSSLGIRTPLSQIPLLGPLLFWKYNMNEIINKFLLAGNAFKPEMHLRQPGLTYSASGTFNKDKEIINKT